MMNLIVKKRVSLATASRGMFIVLLSAGLCQELAFAPRAAIADGQKAARNAARSNPNGSDSDMRDVIERYVADRGSLNRFFAIPMSPSRHARFRQFYAEWLDRLQRVNFDALGQDGRVDYLLFKNHLDHELRQLDIQGRAFAEAQPLIPFAPSIIELEEARRRMEPIDSARAAASLTKLNKQIQETRKGLEAEVKAGPPKVKKTVANRAATIVNSLRTTLKNWFGFYDGYDPVFTWWVADPYKQIDRSLEGYAVFIREKLVGVKPGNDSAIIGDPIGRDALMSELAYEMGPYTPEELVAIANTELAWCEAGMKRASRDLACAADWSHA